MRKAAAQTDAKTVLMGEGSRFRYGLEWSNARIPAFAAVSPNLETGPIILCQMLTPTCL